MTNLNNVKNKNYTTDLTDLPIEEQNIVQGYFDQYNRNMVFSNLCFFSLSEDIINIEDIADYGFDNVKFLFQNNMIYIYITKNNVQYNIGMFSLYRGADMTFDIFMIINNNIKKYAYRSLIMDKYSNDVIMETEEDIMETMKFMFPHKTVIDGFTVNIEKPSSFEPYLMEDNDTKKYMSNKEEFNIENMKPLLVS